MFTEHVQDQSDEEEEGATPRVKLSLCANPTLERLTVAVYQCDSLEVRDVTILEIHNNTIWFG